MQKINLFLVFLLVSTFNFQPSCPFGRSPWVTTFNCVFAAEKGMLFSDDFKRGADNWEATVGTWEVDNGEYVGTESGESIAGDEKWTDYVYELRMKTDEAGEQSWNVGCIMFRYADKDNRYFLLLHTSKKIELGKRQNGQHIPGLKSADNIADPKQWNTIRVELKGGNIKVSVNGKQAIDYTDPDPISEGKIGLWINGGSTVCRYDDIKVWEYGKAPTTVEGSKLKVESSKPKEEPKKEKKVAQGFSLAKDEKAKEEPIKAEAAELTQIFSDDFSKVSTKWEVTAGEWNVKDGKYFVKEEGNRDAISFASGSPDVTVGTIEAKIVVKERLNAASWSFAGITLMLDSSNFWLFAFTEGPDKSHYIDFLESYQGKWQAQNESGTKLEASINENMGLKWEYNKEYKFRLELDKNGLTGLVIDPAKNETLSKRRWEFGKADAIRMGKPGLISRGMLVSFDDVNATGVKKKEVLSMAKVKIEEGKEGRIAILKDNLPLLDLSVVEHIAKLLRSQGFGVTFLSGDDVCEPQILNSENFFLYIIPNARIYPSPGIDVLKQYARSKGNLMVLGGPAFKDLVWKEKDKWFNKELLLEMLATTKPENIFLDFEEDVSNWTVATNDQGSGGSLEIVGGGKKGKCLKYEVSNLTGWTTFYSPPMDNMFPSGHNLFCFWAKGDEKTPYMLIEFNEQDGSRWIGVVKLMTEWKYYALTHDDFPYWKDSPTKDKRGRAGDCFNPENAAKINFGLSFGFTNVGGGPHTFWVDEVGSAKNPFGKIESGKPASSLCILETLSPTYKVYPLSNISSVQVEPNQVIIDKSIALPVSADGIAPIRRPKGAGFGNKRRWRWIPLVNALDKNKEERGVITWMLINNASPYKSTVFSSFGINDQKLFKDAGLSSVLAEMVRRTKEGIFLFEAGSQYFSYYPGESVKLGAEVINTGEKDAEVTVQVQVARVGQGFSPADAVFKNESKISVKSRESGTVEFEWNIGKPDSDLYLVKTELIKEGKIIDVISHELGILSDKKPSPDEFVTVKGNDFYLKGKKWYMVGINFWPLYVSGSEPGDYSLGWLDKGFYDPEEVEKDLVRMNVLGMNMASIQMGAKQNIRNLLDFLRRCEKHNIKANGFLGSASPIAFDEKLMSEFIQVGNLANNTAIFAYDIIWEPGNSMFNADGRKRWEKNWNEWIIERYGSVENAEKDWNFNAPRSGDGKAPPTDAQMKTDGDWRIFVSAYRRFMDDLMSRKWNDAHRRIKKYDSNHLISFRQGNTLPHDFALTAVCKHIDFICPEGYSIQHSEDGYNASGFITRYVNFTTRGKPIYWSEFGKSAWDKATMQPVPDLIKSQGDYHEMYYKMVLEAGANGTAPWWWPGGYRVNEQSDYGIINPDGTFRSAAEFIRKYSPMLTTPRSYPEPNHWMTIDRDANAGGYWYLAFNDGKDEYKKARSMGKNLGIKTEGTGTNSANTPLVAAGNVPYSGNNPPKYLNAEFNWIKVKNVKGEWVELYPGSTTVEVEKDKPVMIKASIGNLGEAEWFAPALHPGKGSVYLSAKEGDITFKEPILKDTPIFKDAETAEFTLTKGISSETKVVMQMTAMDRMWFGEKFTVKLIPK